ncbi:hypothetical protein [Sphingomonas sp.]|jgi:hypothetical protein|uniref:hypothetical protein n=1 Tax=Sphingomonas sp. TaxID=28214 RepID=UPI002EDB919D
MIPSGTHAPDVPATVFEGPANTALRYERPDPRVIDFVSDYYVLDSDGPHALGAIEWSMPGPANIRLFMDERPVNVAIGSRVFAPTPHVALYGPTGRALRIEAFGGVTIGMGITALGWARLFDKSADQYQDRIVPLGDVMQEAPAAELHARLSASDRALEVKAILDSFFLEHLGPPHPDEPQIRRVMALVVDEAVGDLSEVAERAALTPQQLRQISLRYFGFPPKRLLRRGRFLRSLLRMYAAGSADYGLISRSYFDVPHFLRDAEEFLGTTPRRFMAMQTPYLRHIIRARTAVFGVPAQALFGAGSEPEA